MDLFGDLPEPSKKPNHSSSSERLSLYDDIPAKPTNQSTKAAASLYDDIPAKPTNQSDKRAASLYDDIPAKPTNQSTKAAASLYDDIPAKPTNQSDKRAASLYDDIPAKPTNQSTKAAVSLYDDIPAKPTNQSDKRAASLYDDIPAKPTNQSTKAAASLYDDIPAKPTNQSDKRAASLYDDIPTKPANQSAKAGISLYEQTSSDKKPTDELQRVKHEGTLSKEGINQQSRMTGGTEKRKTLSDDLCNSYSKKQKAETYSVCSYLKERQGERDEMQDAHLIIEDFTKEFTDLHHSIYRMSLYGVFDGHGGVKASRFASENLHKNLRDKILKDDVEKVILELKKSFIEAFKKTDEDFLKEATKYKPPWKDGTTAILILLLNETMFIANIGDSQAVLCRYKEDQESHIAIPLSTPHNPSLYEERMRIQKAKGHVKDGRVMGVLEVSRSIGDGQFKKLGITCIPEVKKCQLQDSDRFVVVACDGLWKCFDPQESIKFVNDILADETIEGTETKTAEEVRYDTACARLANEAVLRLSADNVTVLLLALSKSTDS